MDQFDNTTDATDSNDSGGSKATPGERLDRLITKARRLTEAAAPRIRQFGETASEKISQVASQKRSEGSVLQKGMAFYKGASKKRKQIILGIATAVVAISVLILGVLLKSAGNRFSNGPSEATLETAPVGTKVNRLSTLTETAVKQAESSIRKLVGVSDDWNPST
jgi:hypothetical protein